MKFMDANSFLNRACVLSKFGLKDCYRTPMSGGHKYAGESDLVISPSLQRVVPFCIECKHHKSLRTSHLFHPTELPKSFHAQVLKACARDPFKRRPLLVLRGGDLETYAALPAAALLAWFADE